jgi:hypothetical protein
MAGDRFQVRCRNNPMRADRRTIATEAPESDDAGHHGKRFDLLAEKHIRRSRVEICICKAPAITGSAGLSAKLRRSRLHDPAHLQGGVLYDGRAGSISACNRSIASRPLPPSRHGTSVGPHDVTIKILCILRYSQAPLVGVLQSEIFE